MAGSPGSLVVKNTFLELEPAPDAPVPGQLVRSHTAPPRFAPVAVTGISLYGDDPEAVAGEEDEGKDDDDEVNAEIMGPPPHAPTELQRLQTGYRVYDEPLEDWQWDGGTLAAEATPGGTPCQMVLVPVCAPMAAWAQPVQVMQSSSRDAPAGTGPVGPPGGGPPRPQTLQRSTSVRGGRTRVEWAVDANKLRGKDKVAVSPPFDLTCGGRILPFRMSITPRKVTDKKGGGSFRESGGRGCVTIKCEADLDTSAALHFRIYTGKYGVNNQTPRGPVEHDFLAHPLGTLPKGIEEWDFSEVKDDASSTFVVGLEVLMQYQ